MSENLNGAANTMPMRALETKGTYCEPCHRAHKLHIADGVASDLGVTVAHWTADELRPRLPHPTAMIVQPTNSRPALVVMSGSQQLGLKKVSGALKAKGGTGPGAGRA